MQRQGSVVVWVAAGLLMLLVALASSSGPVRLWTTPLAVDVAPAAIGPGELSDRQVDTQADGDASGWTGGLLNTFAGVVILLLVGAGLALAVGELRPSVRLARLRWIRGRSGPAEHSPEVIEAPLDIDVDAARAALSAGTPRNAIVECWMQLEHDAAAAGLRRIDSETATEYVQRVVLASSVDPDPIAELGSLYLEARFSDHELSEADRARAQSVLQDVVAALVQRTQVLT